MRRSGSLKGSLVTLCRINLKSYSYLLDVFFFFFGEPMSDERVFKEAPFVVSTCRAMIHLVSTMPRISVSRSLKSWRAQKSIIAGPCCPVVGMWCLANPIIQYYGESEAFLHHLWNGAR